MTKRRSTRRKAVSVLENVFDVSDDAFIQFQRDKSESDFSLLPEAIILSIFLRLEVKDIANCSCSCKAFASITSGDAFWQLYCGARWGQKTNPDLWISKKKHHFTTIPNLPRPTNFRDLSLLLSCLDPLVGVWQGSLKPHSVEKDYFTFVWDMDSLQCRKRNVFCDTYDYLEIGPHHYITAEVVDGCHCILKDYTKSHAQVRCSDEALAAASVAVGPLGGRYNTSQDALMGISAEMMDFFQSNVYSKKKTKGKDWKVPKIVPYIYHFTRIETPIKTKRKWLAGLWTNQSFSQDHTHVEFLIIDYEFSNRKTKLRVQFIGGADLPSGDILWEFVSKDSTKRNQSKEENFSFVGCGFMSQKSNENLIMIDGTMTVISENCLCFTSSEVDIYRNGRSLYQRLSSSYDSWFG